jgi:alpha-methylacyl-CoA racemase
MIAEGRWIDAAGVNFADTGSHYYEVYECADGKYLAVGAIEPQFYAALLEGLGLDAATLPRQNDAASWPVMKQRLAAIFATRERDRWVERFAGLDACVAPVLSLGESPAHPHHVAREAFVEHDGIVQPMPAPRFDRTPSSLGLPPPHPGEHTREVLAALGRTNAEIDALLAAGAAG